MGRDIIVVKNLVKIYEKNVKALDSISFTVKEGEIYGLIGPNGAGKTTTLRIMATVLEPTSGDVLISGYSIVKEPDNVRKLISYLPEEAGGYKYLTGLEFLEFIASFYFSEKEEIRKAVIEGARLSGLGNALNRKIKTYSKGMLRRLLVAKTLMVKPCVALLDEPTSGLDVINSVKVRDAIKTYAKKHGVTVVVSSHNMLEVEYLCDRVGIIHKGKILVEGNPEELKEKYGAENLEEVFTILVGEKH